RAQMGSNVLRGYKAGFGNGDREAAIGNVVGGDHDSMRCESDETIDQAPFGGEVDSGRFACHGGADGFCVLGGGEFAGEQRFLAALGMTSGGTGAVEQDDGVAGGAEGDFEDPGCVVEQAEDADDGSWIDGFAEGFIVEADVAAGDGCAEGGRGAGDAIYRLGELPHDFGFFRATEVQTVRGGDWTRAASGDIAGGFGHGVHRAELRIELAPAAVAVGC